jgi:UDP-N-acetyl-D-glucosamine dehydrogenase
LKTVVAVIGLGYVGLPLAIAAAKAGYKVQGIDVDVGKINLMAAGKSPIEDVSDRDVVEALNGNLMIGSDFSIVSAAKIVIICVPTPLTLKKEPDLSILKSAVQNFAPYLTNSTLVILESTVQPGTTRELLASSILRYSNLSLEDISLVYSPERIDPLNKDWNIKSTPKLIAGLTKEAAVKAENFYSRFIDRTIVCESLEIAELAKLLENSFRYVNISFINELSMFCRSFGVDINQVIAAASTKPYGFMPFYPSIGVGGHCIPVDPLYLAATAKKLGVQTRFIDLADEINTQMPNYFLKVAKEKIGGLRGKKVLVIGVSYKPNVADVRETPVEALIFGLRKEGAQVFWHDDLVKEWNDEKSSPLDQGYNLAILATAHDYLNLKQIGNTPLINTRESI